MDVMSQARSIQNRCSRMPQMFERQRAGELSQAPPQKMIRHGIFQNSAPSFLIVARVR
jgi:hypothetical protein